MSKPSADDIKKFEAAHKGQFASLVIANNLWLAMPGKYGFNPKDTTTKKYKSWMKMGLTIAQLAGKWGARQLKLEGIKDANVEKLPREIFTGFLKKDKQKLLSDTALKLVKVEPGKGLGFIPLLIWGIIALIAVLSAAYIIDETTTTAQEKGELLRQTEQTLKDLNIPPDKAADIIKESQHDASQSGNGLFGGGDGLTSLLPIGILAFLLMSNKSNK